MRIELIYEKSCPHVGAARTRLLQAFARLGAAPVWMEWEASDPQAPAYIHNYGSPAILVNGKDITGEVLSSGGYCCRIYPAGDGKLQGVPAVENIVDSIKSMHASLPVGNESRGRWQLNGVLLPAVTVALLPKLVCPACWPAYTGLLSSIGLGFVDYTPYLLPLTLVFLAIALMALFYRADNRRGLYPFSLGVMASLMLVAGKFHYGSDAVMYTGLALLIVASLWNTWPKRLTGLPCDMCVDQDRLQGG